MKNNHEKVQGERAVVRGSFFIVLLTTILLMTVANAVAVDFFPQGDMIGRAIRSATNFTYFNATTDLCIQGGSCLSTISSGSFADLNVSNGTNPIVILDNETLRMLGGAGIIINTSGNNVTVVNVLGSSITTDEITDGTILEADLNINNSATLNRILVSNGGTGFSWQPITLFNVLTTSTNFGGDVSGTYNSIVVTPNSTTLDCSNITGSTSNLCTVTDTDTNANTICSGTTVYLDGEGNCDNLSTVYQAAGSYYSVGGTDVALADGGTGNSLTDPNADRILFWDDSAGVMTWLTASTGLTISTTSMTVRSASTSQTGIAETATAAEVAANTDTLRYITPATLSSIDTLGTITTGTWQATAIADAYISSASNWNTAFGWGDHSTEGYLTSYTETDPHFVSNKTNIGFLNDSETVIGVWNFQNNLTANGSSVCTASNGLCSEFSAAGGWTNRTTNTTTPLNVSIGSSTVATTALNVYAYDRWAALFQGDSDGSTFVNINGGANNVGSSLILTEGSSPTDANASTGVALMYEGGSNRFHVIVEAAGIDTRGDAALSIESGNKFVGIGVVDPNETLHVGGDAIVAGNITMTGANSQCFILPSGGKLCGNSTCTVIHSPNGATITEVCN